MTITGWLPSYSKETKLVSALCLLLNAPPIFSSASLLEKLEPLVNIEPSMKALQCRLSRRYDELNGLRFWMRRFFNKLRALLTDDSTQIEMVKIF